MFNSHVFQFFSSCSFHCFVFVSFHITHIFPLKDIYNCTWTDSDVKVVQKNENDDGYWEVAGEFIAML